MKRKKEVKKGQETKQLTARRMRGGMREGHEESLKGEDRQGDTKEQDYETGRYREDR